MSVPAPDVSHYKTVAKAIRDGQVVPFFGAGVNLCGRPDIIWRLGSRYLPSGLELAQHLADEFVYPSKDALNLLSVAQYVALMRGTGPLYEALHMLFDVLYRPTALHRFFAN